MKANGKPRKVHLKNHKAKTNRQIFVQIKMVAVIHHYFDNDPFVGDRQK